MLYIRFCQHLHPYVHMYMCTYAYFLTFCLFARVNVHGSAFIRVQHGRIGWPRSTSIHIQTCMSMCVLSLLYLVSCNTKTCRANPHVYHDSLGFRRSCWRRTIICTNPRKTRTGRTFWRTTPTRWRTYSIWRMSIWRYTKTPHMWYPWNRINVGLKLHQTSFDVTPQKWNRSRWKVCPNCCEELSELFCKRVR